MDFPTATANPSSFTEASDLSKLCLPQEYKDTNRRLAWINSICVLFLAIGIVGLKPPPVHVRPLSEVTEIVPIVITPPEDTPPPPKTEQTEEPEPAPDNAPETPVVAVVVATSGRPAIIAIAITVIPAARIGSSSSGTTTKRAVRSASTNSTSGTKPCHRSGASAGGGSPGAYRSIGRCFDMQSDPHQRSPVPSFRCGTMVQRAQEAFPAAGVVP